MGVKFQAINTTHLILGAAAVGVAFFVYKEAKQAAAVVADKVNPINQENIFNEGFNAVTEAVTGQEGFSFGAWLAGKLNPPEKYQAQIEAERSLQY